MPTPDLRDHRGLVHTILIHTQTLLEREEDASCPPMADLLKTATDTVCDQQAGRVSPHHAAWLEAEAAAHIVTAAGWHATGLTDPALPDRLARINHHTRAGRLRLVAIAAHLSDPERPATDRTVRIPRPRTPVAPGPRPGGKPGGQDRQQTRACPCACNHGGTCGGCGHTGCGGRR